MQWGSQEGLIRLPQPRRKGRHRAPREPRTPPLRRAGKHEPPPSAKTTQRMHGWDESNEENNQHVS